MSEGNTASDNNEPQNESIGKVLRFDATTICPSVCYEATPELDDLPF